MQTNHLSIVQTFHLFLCLLFLSSCSTETNIPTPQPESTPTPEVVISAIPIKNSVNIEGFTTISANNIHKLDLISNLGTGQLYHAALSPDGKTLAALTASGIYLIDSETFEEINYFERYNQSDSAISFTPDGNSLIFSSGFTLYSITTDFSEINYLFPSAIPKWDINSIEFTPDGENVIIVSSGTYYPCEGTGKNFALYSPNGFLLFDRYFCKQLAYSYYHPIGIDKTAFVFNNVMSVGVPYELHVIDNKTGIVLASSYKRGGYFDAEGEVEETILGNRAYLPSIDKIEQWNQENYEDLQLVHLENCDTPIGLAHDYETIQIEGDISFLISKSNNKIIAINQSTCEIKNAIQFIKNDESKFNPVDSLINLNTNNSISVWNPVIGKENFLISTDFFRYPNTMSEFNHSGNVLVTSMQGSSNVINEIDHPNNGVQVWNAFTGELMNEFSFPSARINAIQATPSDDIMFIQTSKGNGLWNILTGKRIQTLPDGVYVSDEFHNGVWLFKKISEYQYKPLFYNHETGELLRELTLIQGKNLEVSLSEDAAYFNLKYIHANSPDWIVHRKLDILTDTTRWQKIDKGSADHSSRYPSDPFGSWTYKNDSNENRFLFQNGTVYESGILQSNDNNIILTRDNSFWNTETGEYLGKMNFTFEIKEANFSPNGYFLAITSTDGIVRIFGIRDE
jgi:DNA-binding beta-propeller fold protein YncE